MRYSYVWNSCLKSRQYKDHTTKKTENTQVKKNYYDDVDGR